MKTRSLLTFQQLEDPPHVAHRRSGSMQQPDFTEPSIGSSLPSTRTAQDVLGPWFSGRRGLILGGVAIVVAGLALGWNWLSAIGVAPIILSVAPCAAMCALGACAMMRGNSSCAKPGAQEQAKPAETTLPPTRPDEQAT
jgi:hypothetical protein